MTRRPVPTGVPLRKASFTLAAALALPSPVRAVFGWGHEGHRVIALIAAHYMTLAALTRASDLLDGATIDSCRAGPTTNPRCARVGFGDIGGQASGSRTSSV